MVDEAASDLFLRACEARAYAHAPYSQYHVGAALRATDGRIFTGCNVENASYGLTICAERVALGTAIAAGQRHFTELAVAGPSESSTVPCGACRQVLTEFGLDLQVVYLRAGELVVTTLRSLLPEHFAL